MLDIPGDPHTFPRVPDEGFRVQGLLEDGQFQTARFEGLRQAHGGAAVGVSLVADERVIAKAEGPVRLEDGPGDLPDHRERSTPHDRVVAFPDHVGAEGNPAGIGQNRNGADGTGYYE